MNLVVLIGRVANDIDVRMTTSGNKVCKFSLAVDDGKDANGNRKAQFIDCEGWNQSADFLQAYCKKGLRIAVTGRLVKTVYEDKNGTKHYPTNVVASRVEFADGANRAQDEVQTAPAQNAPRMEQTRMGSGFGLPASIGIDSDDLPF